MQNLLVRLKLPLIIILAFLLLWNISAVTAGVKNALSLCAFSIIPSLFVFLVLSDMITSLLLSESRAKLQPKWVVFLLGLLCGFPVGAVICDRFYKSGFLSAKDAERLLPLCNNTSPAFVIGAIGTAILGNVKLGILLFSAQLLSALFFFLPLRIQKGETVIKSVPQSLSDQFFSAIEKAVSSILKICALICLFSALLAVLHLYCGETSYSLFATVLEIGNGSAAAGALFASTPVYSIMLCGFACGWSGICVHLQVFSALKSIKVNKIRFCIYKFAQGIYTSAIAGLGYNLFFYT